MRRVLLAGASGLALLMAAEGSSHATPFDYTGAEQTFTVLTGGDYRIVVDGAQGGAGAAGGPGGLGAAIGGSIDLAAGTILDIIVGGQGAKGRDGGGGGGGGSFVFTSTGTLLAAAGGGGGGPYEPDHGIFYASNANAGASSGTAGPGSEGASGGSGGKGGAAASYSNRYSNGGGGGGAGWAGNGASSTAAYGGKGGLGPTSFAGGQGGEFGGSGGFGGGGGAGFDSGGGGGGYSGGGGGNFYRGLGGGGGGGSLLTATHDGGFFDTLTPVADVKGNGYVSISPATASAVPEPAGAGLLTAALAGLALLRRRRG